VVSSAARMSARLSGTLNDAAPTDSRSASAMALLMPARGIEIVQMI
jgi:hypothetical protein